MATAPPPVQDPTDEYSATLKKTLDANLTFLQAFKTALDKEIEKNQLTSFVDWVSNLVLLKDSTLWLTGLVSNASSGVRYEVANRSRWFCRETVERLNELEEDLAITEGASVKRFNHVRDRCREIVDWLEEWKNSLPDTKTEIVDFELIPESCRPEIRVLKARIRRAENNLERVSKSLNESKDRKAIKQLRAETCLASRWYYLVVLFVDNCLELFPDYREGLLASEHSDLGFSTHKHAVSIMQAASERGPLQGNKDYLKSMIIRQESLEDLFRRLGIEAATEQMQP